MSKYARWQLTCDGALVYQSGVEEYSLKELKQAGELNTFGSLSFPLPPTHPAYNLPKELKSIVVLKYGAQTHFRGRVLNITPDFQNVLKIECEGELGFLKDSIQRPFVFPTTEGQATPADYLAYLLSRHNTQVEEAKRFKMGRCTVTDPNNYIRRSDTEYSTTWALVKESLLDSLGGYLIPRYESDGVYLDYLKDADTLSNQKIIFGVNLLNLSTARKGGGVVTAVVPLGAMDEETEQRLTIETLPNEDTDDICKSGDYVYSKKAVAAYGWIFKTVTWEDVTVASNLLTKSKARLGELRQLPATLSLTAADLANAGYDVNTYRLGTYVELVDDYHSKVHQLLARYLVKKINRDIVAPATGKLTAGATTTSLTDSTRAQTQAAIKQVEASVSAATSAAVKAVEERNSLAISESERGIMTIVTQDYYTRGQTDQLVSSVSTDIQATATEIRILQSQMQRDISDVQANADAKFTSLQKYIQISGGAMTFGEVGNQITLKIENDRIVIYSNDVAVTYWTANDFVAPIKLIVPVGGQLVLGQHAYIPRSNGSLDFTWIGG